MKKSKFLLLGSVASLASIPFVSKLNVVIDQRRKETWARQKSRWDKNPGEKEIPKVYTINQVR
nr:variable surface lipoprotein [Mycoplasmopsis bovis]